MNETHIPEDSIAIGQNAANIAVQAMEDLGRAMIRQKAIDIASQIEIYLNCIQPSLTSLEAIQNDPELAKIAVHPIGLTGYTAVHSTEGINLFHSMPTVVGTDLRKLTVRFAQFRDIIERSLQGDTDGYYDWQDDYGEYRSKYMYCTMIRPASIAPVGLVIAATTFIDEFSQPSWEIRKKITTLAERADTFTRIEGQRAEQMRAVNEISRRISSILSIEELLPFVVDTLQTTFRYDCVKIFLVNDQQHSSDLHVGASRCLIEPPNVSAADLGSKIVEWVATTGQPYLSGSMMKDPSRSWNLESDGQVSHLVVPIQIGSQLLGVLGIGCQKPKVLGETDLFTLRPLADQLAIALENARLYVELREMAVIEERNRIAREIHDTLAQGFAGISMNMEIARQMIEAEETDQLDDLLGHTRDLAREKLQEARRSVHSLHPKVEILGEMDELITLELAKLENSMEVETSLEVSGDLRPVYSTTKNALLRICQEALTNVKKHACASRVLVRLEFEPNKIGITILDNGVGFLHSSGQEGSFGLISMSERARLLGGSLKVMSQPGQGTEVIVSVPC